MAKPPNYKAGACRSSRVSNLCYKKTTEKWMKCIKMAVTLDCWICSSLSILPWTICDQNCATKISIYNFTIHFCILYGCFGCFCLLEYILYSWNWICLDPIGSNCFHNCYKVNIFLVGPFNWPIFRKLVVEKVLFIKKISSFS